MNLNLSRTQKKVVSAWTDLRKSTGLGAIRTEADYLSMRKLADQLVDHIGEDEHHPLSDLLDVVLELMESWEDDHADTPKASPREILQHLMEANGLKQQDLVDIVSQGTLSNILNGKRGVSKELAKKFAERFHVGVSSFL